MSAVIENSRQKGSALLLLLMIANHAHADGTNSFPSIETLAKECRMSVRQVIRLVAALEKSGELQVERSAGRTAHRYVLSIPNPDKLSSTVRAAAPAKRQARAKRNPDKMAGFNPDTTAGLNSDIVSGSEAATLTSAATNPDKSDIPTLTNRVSNPDKSGIAYKEEPSITIIEEPSGEPNTEATPPAAEERSPVDMALDAYRAGFLLRFGAEPHIAYGKDNKIIKALVVSYGLESTVDLIEKYLDSDDDFIVEGGYTIGILSLKLNKLIVQKGNGSGRAKLTARTKSNLAAYDEAMRIGPPKR